MKKLNIYQFTDPACTWCWGAEPILIALQHLYRDQIEIDFIMGGLVEDMHRFHDSDNGIGGAQDDNFDKVNETIASHWEKASAMHKMPTNSTNMNLFSRNFPSTYPQNIAYRAAKLVNPSLAKPFLRRMREATALEGAVTGDINVLTDLAKEVGLDGHAFYTAMTDGSAEKLFYEEDQALVKKYKITVFPSYLLVYDGKEMVLTGSQSVEQFQEYFDMLTLGELSPLNKKGTATEISKFIKEHYKLYPQEIISSFVMDEKSLDPILDDLQKKGEITVSDVGNGQVVTLNGKASN
ncbi:MAG: DsbA family protein [Eubacteriaceae bacterium]|jgi:predicted DsbA family dithiol-disulfide isomerase|nr:DsbA family protein [Eubacteriaceae bacterium]